MTDFKQDSEDYLPPPPDRTLDDLALADEDLPELDEADMPKADQEAKD